MLLNQGVNPHTGETIVPKSAFDAVTTARVIMYGRAPSPDKSVLGYGLGWGRYSYREARVLPFHSLFIFLTLSLGRPGLPEFLTYVGFLPWDGVGVFAFVNNGQAGDAPDLIGTRLIESALGLEHRQSSKLAEQPHTASSSLVVASALPSDIPLMSQPPPPLPLENYTGTYFNPGYGAFTLCSEISTSNYCSQVLTTFLSIRPPNRLPGLYASWSRFWTKHVRLTHQSGHGFGFETFTLFPEGYGRNTTAFSEVMFGNKLLTALFDVEDGVVRGLALPNEIADSGVSTSGKALSLENAIVYFHRV